jgi:hypothetical protein
MVKQRVGFKCGFQRDSGIQIVGLILRAKRRRAVERGDSDHAALRDLSKGVQRCLYLFQRRCEITADGDIAKGRGHTGSCVFVSV